MPNSKVKETSQYVANRSVCMICVIFKRVTIENLFGISWQFKKNGPKVKKIEHSQYLLATQC